MSCLLKRPISHVCLTAPVSTRSDRRSVVTDSGGGGAIVDLGPIVPHVNLPSSNNGLDENLEQVRSYVALTVTQSTLIAGQFQGHANRLSWVSCPSFVFRAVYNDL